MKFTDISKNNQTVTEMVGYNQGKPTANVFTGRKPAKKNPTPFDKSADDKKSQLQRMKDAGKKNWYAIEGMLDNPGAEDSPVASAITRRILLQRTDLLAKYGPEKVGQAVDEVADFVGDVDEIGSSDVSGWVRHVEQMLGNMNEQGVAEVSQQTLQSYRKKAAKQKSDALDVTDRPDTDDATWVKNINIASKRKDGIAAANKRLGVAEGSSTTWEVSYDYGPHMSKTVTVKASSESEARAKVEKAAEKKGLDIMINSVESAEQGVAEVSKATLDQYVPKAVDAHGHADFSARMSKDDPTKRSYHVDQKRTAEKRRQGISRALDRMSKMEEGTGSVNVGDDVIVTGAVKYKGATGVVDSVGRDGDFIVVNLYNHGKQSFQSTDVSPNDYAGSEAEETEMQQRGLGESAPRSALGKAIGNFKNKAVTEASNSEYDDEAGMAESNLLTMNRAVQGLLKTIEDNDNLPEWAQEKLAKAEMMLVSVWDYLQSQKEQGINPKVIGESAKGHSVEAHGVKGMNNKAWRKTFKNAEQAYAWAEKNDAEVKGTRDLEAAKTGNLSPAVKEGAKVDRMVKHITKSEKAAGKSSAEAEDIAWATANKRGMLDNKNKKTESTKARASKKY